MTRHLFAVALVGGLFALAGCGGGPATVSGTVTYQGKPVVWGGVALVAADGSSHQATLNRDGTYTIPSVPRGTAKVGVTSPDPFPEGKNGKYEGRYKPPTDLPAGAWVPLPPKFADPQQSGLTVEVGGGSGDLALK